MSITPKHESAEAEREWAEVDRDEFAEERSHEAAKIAYDFGKTTAQAGLIINGGAATAVIALLAKDKVDPVILKTVPWCLALYAFGVAASAVMMFCSMMNAENWNYFWYHISYTADTPNARKHEDRATFWQIGARVSFFMGLISFLAASFVLAIAMQKF